MTFSLMSYTMTLSLINNKSKIYYLEINKHIAYNEYTKIKPQLGHVYKIPIKSDNIGIEQNNMTNEEFKRWGSKILNFSYLYRCALR